MNPAKTIVIAPRGKMGQLIIQSASKRQDLTLIAGVAPENRDYIGKDLGEVARLGHSINAPVVSDLASVISSCEVIIDFSVTSVSLHVLKTALRYNKALVCGTTGFSEEELNDYKNAGEKIPVLYAANTSRLVNIMNALLPIVVRAAGEDVDVEILEMHDSHKKDAPSGTSKDMGEIIASAMGKTYPDIARYGRRGEGMREPGTIGYHSLRAGNIPSSHTVFFGGTGERLEITHHSYNWECFANGACDCAAFLSGSSPGYYTIKDVIKF